MYTLIIVLQDQSTIELEGNMRTVIKTDVVECDWCHKREADPEGWFTFRSHFVLTGPPGWPGELNAAISKHHYDLCSKYCGELMRNSLLFMEQV